MKQDEQLYINDYIKRVSVMKQYEGRSRREQAQEQMRNLNGQLLRMINEIRTLQDELLREQYKSQAVRQEQDELTQIVSALSAKRQSLQKSVHEGRHRLSMQREEHEQLSKCEDHLKDINREMQIMSDLTQSKIKHLSQIDEEINKGNQQTQQIKADIELMHQERRLVESYLERQGQGYRQRDAQTYVKRIDQQRRRDNEIERELKKRQNQLNEMQQSIRQKQEELKAVKRQYALEQTAEKQQGLQIQYEIRLQQEREQDLRSKESLLKQCLKDTEIENIIEQMLKREDQLEQQIVEGHSHLRNLKANYSQQARSKEQSHRKQLQSIVKQIEFNNESNDKLRKEIQLLKHKVNENKQAVYNISLEVKNNKSLSLEQMRRVREVTERSKLLTYEVQELEAYKQLLLQEQSIFSEESKI